MPSPQTQPLSTSPPNPKLLDYLKNWTDQSYAEAVGPIAYEFGITDPAGWAGTAEKLGRMVRTAMLDETADSLTLRPLPTMFTHFLATHTRASDVRSIAVLTARWVFLSQVLLKVTMADQAAKK